jgi:type IV pilus assembly protein PilM
MNFFRKKIFNIEPVSFGLDLSDLSVKAIQIERYGSSDSLVGFSSVPIPMGAISEGQIIKPDDVVSAIKKALQTSGPHRIKTKKVICSLPETKAFMRIISIPRMDIEEVHEAVKWEMEANIPLPLDQVYYDWQILDDSLTGEKNKLNLIVVAIAKNAVDSTIEILEKAGLDPIGLEIESIAEARSLLDQKDENSTTLIVDIGDRRTSFLIAKGSTPAFTSSVPISGQSLTDAISKGMNISFEEAEKIKFSQGIGAESKNDALFKFVKPVLENLTEEIERSIDFYLSGLAYSKDIDKVILCGGGANTKGMLPYLSKKINRRMELGNPLINFNFGKKLPFGEKDSPVRYATVIGLALKGLN